VCISLSALGYSAKRVLISNKHRLLASLDQRNESARLGDLRRLVDDRDLEIHFPEGPQPGAGTSGEHDLCGLDPFLRFFGQPVILVHVPSYASVDRVVLESFADFQTVRGDAKDLIVRDDVFFGVQFDESLEDVIDG
jgi:hypothetical protein